ncbi:MAG: protein kinase [Planctomycetota bacterium]|nr:protein kinase [Planctomycetota bacterium]
MTLSQGQLLSHYSILGPLGAGAMGEVYRARDTKLGREVAIKVLPEHFADEPERLKRFEREATTLASLNHPNVAQIFGVDQVGDTCFLVLELVPGESLDARLKRGPLPFDEALEVCRQIAEGLEAAHEAGVIHRDLKPANVLLTPDGRVKILDFGLAKTAIESSKGSSTDSVLSTEAGRLLGTPTYMAPEQARGKSIDKRVDIWAFGCVLYECLTAKRAFAGETLTDVLGAVLHSQADLSALPPTTPRRVRELLTRCFEKDPRRRLRDIGDARLELEAARAQPEDARAQPGARATSSTRVLRFAPWISSAALAALAVFFALRAPSSQSAPEAEQRVVRATLALPKGMVLPAGDRFVAISPDGTHVVVSVRAQEGTSPPSLYVRDLSRLEYRPLPGTEDAAYPFWSPDGRSIAFFAGRKLKRIDLADGIVRALCDAGAGRGGTWGTKGTIVFAPGAAGGLSIVDESGGSARPITQPTTRSESHRVPHMLPDGQRFLYYAMNIAAPGVYAFDPATGQSRFVLSSETEAVFVEPGALVYGRDENLVVQPFDAVRLEPVGSAQPIAPGVQWDSRRVSISMGISARGTLVYQPVARASTHRLAWMDRKGERTPIPVEPFAIEGALSLAPDGRRAAVNVIGDRGETQLAVLDLERGVRTWLGDPKAKFYYGALWAPRGPGVIATDANSPGQQLVSFPIAGGPPTPLFESEPECEYSAASFTPDGRTLLFSGVPMHDKVGDIMTIDLESGRVPKRLMATPEAEWSPLVSPAGNAVLFSVSAEGDLGGSLRVVTFPTPSAPVQVSRNPTLWMYGWLSGSELYWVDASRSIWSATVTVTGGDVDVGAPKPLFDGRPLEKGASIVAYDIARERFLVAIEASPREDTELILVSDWRPDAVSTQAVRK